MHPEALETFSAKPRAGRSVLATVEKCGGRLFPAWQGVPIFPSNKLFLTPKAKKTDPATASDYQLLPRVPVTPPPKSHCCGWEEKQGVVGLYAAKKPREREIPLPFP